STPHEPRLRRAFLLCLCNGGRRNLGDLRVRDGQPLWSQYAEERPSGYHVGSERRCDRRADLLSDRISVPEEGLGIAHFPRRGALPEGKPENFLQEVIILQARRRRSTRRLDGRRSAAER